MAFAPDFPNFYGIRPIFSVFSGSERWLGFVHTDFLSSCWLSEADSLWSVSVIDLRSDQLNIFFVGHPFPGSRGPSHASSSSRCLCQSYSIYLKFETRLAVKIPSAVRAFSRWVVCIDFDLEQVPLF